MTDQTAKIDYTIPIPAKQTAERIGCQWCKHVNSCQYHIEIFEEHWGGWRNEVNHRTKTEIIGTLCKHFEK